MGNLPNTMTSIMPKILARGLMTLRERAVMPRLVNMDYSTDAAQKGSTVDVPIPSAIAATTVTPNNVPVDATALTPSTVAINLDKWYKSTPFGMTDKELVELDENRHFVPMQIDEAVRGLANQVNADCFAEYKNVGRVAEAPAEGIFGDVSQITAARRALNQENAPIDNRRIVCNFVAEDALLQLSNVTAFNEVGNAGGQPRVSGEIGSRFGFDIYADDAVPYHATTGTPTDNSILIDNTGGYAAGTKAIHVDGVDTGIIVGDVLEIDHGGSTGKRQYAVAAVGALSTNDQDITLSTGLAAAVADNVQLDLVASHTVNLAFHRDAFALATRPLMAETSMYDGMNSNMMSMTDPLTGLSLRLEVTRQYKQVVWEFDILYGVKLVRPELACRIVDVAI